MSVQSIKYKYVEYHRIQHKYFHHFQGKWQTTKGSVTAERQTKCWRLNLMCARNNESID